MNLLPIILWLVFVQPSGETYTQQEQDVTIQHVREATAFWGYDAEIRTSFLITDKDVFNETLDQWSPVPTGNDGITIYVVDTSSNQLFFNRYGGYAQQYYQIITVVQSTNLGASVAHELGHVLYGLPDWYTQPGKCDAIDIMCDAVAAYSKKIKGCLTLDFIGTPCYTIIMPLIHKGDDMRKLQLKETEYNTINQHSYVELENAEYTGRNDALYAIIRALEEADAPNWVIRLINRMDMTGTEE